MDIANYKQIVAELRPMLLQLAQRITGNQQDAQDAVQDVCLQLWHRRNDVAHGTNVEAYCVQMTKNRCIDKLRARHPEETVEHLSQSFDSASQPDKALEEKDNYVLLRKIIATLPPLQQQILKLKDIDELDTPEIVEITGLAPEAIRNNLSRARKRIRELFLAYQHNNTSRL